MDAPAEKQATVDSWDCKLDGHEYESHGEYDPDTNSYPYMRCSHCGKEKEWEPPEYDYDYDY